ncbi:hypothetical protein NDU88_009972 [Pleurodeles waltl]|uniref:Uncharacterized protein n=1 Tax=Pleurodeles waltl TaxID=8319 RepID=A0AAV7PTK5_PLEWA|nr:hypothetical protein NDU88_009972 [Pleurodeles waltl]
MRCPSSPRGASEQLLPLRSPQPPCRHLRAPGSGPAARPGTDSSRGPPAGSAPSRSSTPPPAAPQESTTGSTLLFGLSPVPPLLALPEELGDGGVIQYDARYSRKWVTFETREAIGGNRGVEFIRSVAGILQLEQYKNEVEKGKLATTI